MNTAAGNQGLNRARDEPSLRLILACAHLHSGEVEHDRVRSSVLEAGQRQGDIDWDRFLQLTDWHHVAPLVRKTLDRTASADVPARVRSGLARQCQDNTRRALLQASELSRLAALFATAEIPWFLLKGPSLALLAYGDLGLRHAGDLDLLLRDKEDLAEAHRLLTEAGYRQSCPGFPLSPRQALAYTRTHHDFSYLHPYYGLRVELHWRWTANPVLFPLDLHQAWERRGTLSIGGNEICLPGNEDLLLYLCMHGSQHAWFRLHWLCDLPTLIQAATPAMDAGTLARRARRLGIERMLSQGLRLAMQLLGTSLPPDLALLAGSVQPTSRLLRFPCRALGLGPAFRNERQPLGVSIEQFRYKTTLRKEAAYKAGELTSYAMCYRDWQLLPLPDPLYPLYYPLRPILWAVRRLRDRRAAAATQPTPTMEP